VNRRRRVEIYQVTSKPAQVTALGIRLGEICLLPNWRPAWRRRDLDPGFGEERGNLSSWCEGRSTSERSSRGESTDTRHRGGAVRSRDEGSVMELDRRGGVVQPDRVDNPQGDDRRG
jgi:hypothetical protein